MNSQIPTPSPSENPAPSPIPSGVKPEGKKSIVFETIFVAVFLIILIGILNYFNILKLSEIFPNYLGWLPHKSEQSKQLASPTGGSSNAIISPTDQDKQALTSFIPTVIASSYAPKSSSDIVLVQGKTAKDDFLAAWSIKDGKATVRFVSSKDGQIASIYVFLNYILNKPVSADLAKETVPQFFLPIPKEKFSCKPLSNDSNYCESFWEEDDGTKKGVGIQQIGASTSETDAVSTTVFFCQFTKESSSYSQKSCSSEFAETGVK